MSRPSPLVRSHGLDLLIVVTAAVSALEVALGQGPRAPTSTAWFASPALALVILPLLGHRRFPFAGPAAVWLLAASLSLLDGRLVPFAASASVAGFGAAFLLGHLRDAHQARLGLVLVIGAAAIIVYDNPAHSAGQMIFSPALFGLGWVAGFALRTRAEQAEVAVARAQEAERERAAATRVAVAEERTRIARELHDVVAHAVSVMVLQVGSVRHHLPEGLVGEREALHAAEQAGRTALAEMRQLLGAMRQDGEGLDLAPSPGLDGLDDLAEQLSRTGVTVEVRVEGEPVPLPRALDLSAFRIVQEGLTNVLKHGGVRRAGAVVRYGPGEVEIEVRNPGNGARSDQGDRDQSGFGLIGVRERVRVYGGEMSARALDGGGFVLTARLPIDGEGR